jgi:hypothetical protein
VTVARFAIATLAVLLFILVIMLAQGLGQSVGHGVQEWLVR